MKLAIFDLDNTLIAGDSDHAWGEFLVAQGLVDGVWYKAQNDKFYADYCTGQLDIIAYSEFVFGFLAQHDMSYLQQLHQQFMAQVIQPIMLPKAQALIQQHRRRWFLLIITATNRFITQPIGEALGISELLATEPQQQVGRYTGKVVGAYCPNILFPYVREAISDLVGRGSFPQLLLAPVNFDALFAQAQQQRAQQQAAPAATIQ